MTFFVCLNWDSGSWLFAFCIWASFIKDVVGVLLLYEHVKNSSVFIVPTWPVICISTSDSIHNNKHTCSGGLRPNHLWPEGDECFDRSQLAARVRKYKWAACKCKTRCWKDCCAFISCNITVLPVWPLSQHRCPEFQQTRTQRLHFFPACDTYTFFNF